MAADTPFNALIETLRTLKPHQLACVAEVAKAFQGRLDCYIGSGSDFATDKFASFLGDILRLHHSFSNEPFTKDKFEHAMVRVLTELGHDASLAPRGNPGHDMTFEEERWSLKTQADASISVQSIHISKFMELGQGRWKDKADLAAMRDRMIEHMEAYGRIFVLRCLSRNRNYRYHNQCEYELVEIPKELLLRCRHGEIEMRYESKQNPKPGYCTVTNQQGELLFRLYFDGGTERKLQIKSLSKNECLVHASWKFSLSE